MTFRLPVDVREAIIAALTDALIVSVRAAVEDLVEIDYRSDDPVIPEYEWLRAISDDYQEYKRSRDHGVREEGRLVSRRIAAAILSGILERSLHDDAVAALVKKGQLKVEAVTERTKKQWFLRSDIEALGRLLRMGDSVKRLRTADGPAEPTA